MVNRTDCLVLPFGPSRARFLPNTFIIQKNKMQYPSILEGLFTNQTTYFCLTMCVGNCETFNEFFYLHDPQFLTVA